MSDKKELFNVMNPKKIIFKNTFIRALDHQLKSKNLKNQYNKNEKNYSINNKSINKDDFNSKQNIIYN